MAQFTNQARLTYNDSTINSNIAVGEIREVLSASKTALSDTYMRADGITYVISVINAGTTPITALSITDNLGAYDFGTRIFYPLDYVEGSARVFINGVLQAAPAVTAGPPLNVSGITLPANSSLLLVYEAQVNEFAPLGTDGVITNTATFTGAGITTPIPVSETVRAEAGADLTILKSIDPVPVSPGGRLTYTFLLQNYGNVAADADANAVITDVFDPRLSNLVVSFNGETLTEPDDYTYDEASGLFSTVAGRITVPAATYTQDIATGEWVVTPGVSTLTVTGTI